jgi:hypothetical protein
MILFFFNKEKKMARMTCVALGEVEDSQKYKNGGTASDIVTATTKDIIYFYHIDSCMAAAFFPIDSKSPVVGAHLGMGSPNGEWEFNDLPACAKYYITKLNVYRGNISRAAFIGDSSVWGQAAAEITKALLINNAVFVYAFEFAFDAWALPRIDSAVAWLKWDTNRGFLYEFPENECQETTKKMSEVQGYVGLDDFTGAF